MCPTEANMVIRVTATTAMLKKRYMVPAPVQCFIEQEYLRFNLDRT